MNEQTENEQIDIENVDSLDSLKKQIEEQKNEIESLKDQYLRAVAEVQNVRTRNAKQMEEMAKYAVSNFAKELLNVVDNLYRTIENLPKSDDQIFKNLLEGLVMTQKEFLAAFDKFNVTRIMPKKGDDFDYNLHQAVAQVESEEFGAGKIVDVVSAGYVIHDRLLRPAMVTISK